MSDLFREVDDDLRRERVKRIWSRYRMVFIGIAVLIVVGAGAFRLYEYWQATRAAGSGDRFATAMQYTEENNGLQAEAEFNRLVTEGTGQYPVLAALRIAAAKAAAGDTSGAAADLERVANDPGTPALLRDIARLRSAMMLVDTVSFADLKPKLEPLAGPAAPFRYSAQELLGISAYRNGEFTEAEKYFRDLATSDGAPTGMNQRAEQMLDLIAARRATAAPEG